MARVWSLTYAEYVTMGYCQPNVTHWERHCQLLDCIPETTVFCVEVDDGLIGTISITQENSQGFHTEHAFPDETQAVREECAENGWPLFACWRIVVRQDYNAGREVIRLLLDWAITFGSENGCKEAIFTFNPKHQAFYEHLLGLRLVAGPRDDATVSHAPAVLMRGSMETIAKNWLKRKHLR